MIFFQRGKTFLFFTENPRDPRKLIDRIGYHYEFSEGSNETSDRTIGRGQALVPQMIKLRDSTIGWFGIGN